jgi:hypothetical protein
VSGERDLERLLASLEPVLRPGSFGFAVVRDVSELGGVAPAATVREDEGLSVVLPREEADALGLAYGYVAAWITLRAHSALDAVGLTSAVSRALADAGLSCNVLAGTHHDHLLVPVERGREAVGILQALARGVHPRVVAATRAQLRAREVAHRACVLGETRPLGAWPRGTARILVNGELRQSAPLPPGCDARLAAAADVLGAVGLRLLPGDRILAGSLTHVEAGPGDRVVAEIDSLGRVEVALGA